MDAIAAEAMAATSIKSSDVDSNTRRGQLSTLYAPYVDSKIERGGFHLQFTGCKPIRSSYKTAQKLTGVIHSFVSRNFGMSLVSEVIACGLNIRQNCLNRPCKDTVFFGCFALLKYPASLPSSNVQSKLM